ncbi:hypothetical protein AN161_15840 [Lysinibacillus sp. FJAT-14222]|nr:hypothetical protein AN161_15840 [Lysinibacillus sp. FJAT-14222]
MQLSNLHAGGVSEKRTKVVKAYGTEVVPFSDVPEMVAAFEEIEGDFVKTNQLCLGIIASRGFRPIDVFCAKAQINCHRTWRS